MVNFYPGPSKIYPEISNYFAEGQASGIFEMNHRSDAFHELFHKFKTSLKSHLQIPDSFEVSIISSATEGWEIINQSLSKHTFHHLYNGDFGEKWFLYNQLINPENTNYHKFGLDETIDSLNIKNKEGVICITNNETSNGTCINDLSIRSLKENNPKALIAADSTSILGGIKLDFSNVDICFSSVQKCLGQPSGMGVIFTSERVNNFINKKKVYYNDLNAIIINSKKLETTHTPNIPGIYNLYRTTENLNPISEIDKITKSRFNKLITFFKSVGFYHLSNNKDVHSPTVLTLKPKNLSLKLLFEKAKKHKIIIGQGYGLHKKSTFRIANFPSHTEKDIDTLINFFKTI